MSILYSMGHISTPINYIIYDFHIGFRSFILLLIIFQKSNAVLALGFLYGDKKNIEAYFASIFYLLYFHSCLNASLSLSSCSFLSCRYRAVKNSISLFISTSIMTQNAPSIRNIPAPTLLITIAGFSIVSLGIANMIQPVTSTIIENMTRYDRIDSILSYLLTFVCSLSFIYTSLLQYTCYSHFMSVIWLL